MAKQPKMDKNKHREERKKFRTRFQDAFPNLAEEYEVIQPSTGRYNCIAHTLRKNDQWVNPQTGPAFSPLEVMDAVFAAHSYKRASMMDFSFEPATQKIVVYAILAVDGTIANVTHAAIQDLFGTWESKVGQGPLVRHETPNALSGPAYGQPVALYVRTA